MRKKKKSIANTSTEVEVESAAQTSQSGTAGSASATSRSSGRSNRTTPPAGSPGHSPGTLDVRALRESIITPGFGLSVPSFRQYSNADENAYIPFGVVHGHYLPAGQSSTSELYPELATLHLQRILAQLKNLGYANDYTVAQLRTFFNGVGELLQMQRFVRDLRTMSEYSTINTSSPVSALVSTGINGRLVAQHKRLTKTISVLPFPAVWEEAYLRGMGASTTSDSPFGPIRTFGPKAFQPAAGAVYKASEMADAIEAATNSFFANTDNTELASILADIYPPRPELDMIAPSYITFNNATINNILNLPYYDGINNAPVAADNVNVRYYYRRKIEPWGFLTYAPDDNILSTLQGTVWLQASGGEVQASRIAVDNSAQAVLVNGDENLFSNFGSIWEAALLLTGDPSPSVAHVNTTFSSVSIGVADLMFNH